ncbi:hypothetical protein BCR43DRAFT_498457 [Syncephalastrum racemosum]|uniref:DUF1206 domain-containing protein n=1 Tax=Syncephalastrum racemosum TaxID=13706 RepID=A0A1X2H0V5_SYNRA|nr:hypothetical protein BCR43DRAFT_498457 [Syncephalastrum racemosum]
MRAVRIIGRCGFIAKGVVYGIIGVLICTNVSGAYTPNGSEGNESPQGAFLLLGGIPAVGRPILVIMAVGLVTYLVWRFWEAITGQGCDARLSRRTNFFRYRLSPIVSGCVYLAYLYYLVQMIYQTSEEQQQTAASNSFPGSWTSSTVGSAFIGIFGIAFLIALVTQVVNAVTGNFIPDLKTCNVKDVPRQWEARLVNLSGRVGFGGRAAMFGTLSGFFWDSLAKRNESGDKNMIAAAIGKLSTHKGGRFFMILLGVSLIIYALFAIGNAYYKYFPTPPPSRIPLYHVIDGSEEYDYGQEELHEEEEGSSTGQQRNSNEGVPNIAEEQQEENPHRPWWKRFLKPIHPATLDDNDADPEKQARPDTSTT